MSQPSSIMNQLLTYGADFAKSERSGTLGDHPDPPEPPDIGSALSQDEIDFLKCMIKEMRVRFNQELG